MYAEYAWLDWLISSQNPNTLICMSNDREPSFGMNSRFSSPSARPPQSNAEECRALAQIIDRIGDKWTVMVLGHLSEGTHRFNELMRMIPGISHRMLTLTLRGAECDGLVQRTAFATVPPRVEYALTPLGHTLKEPISMLAGWARSHRDEIEEARARYALLSSSMTVRV
jgi:DNA-binding HxlR family transcriptional regulator